MSSFTKAPRRVDTPTDDAVEVREALEDIERAASSAYEQGEEGPGLAAAS